MKKAVIVLPTYNERKNVQTLIPKILDVCADIKRWSVAILVVDDNSPDKTHDEVRKLQKKFDNVRLISGSKMGLGRAYVRGFSYALQKLHPDVIFEMDADWQHDPHLIPNFLEQVERGSDVVIGSRYIEGGSIPRDWALHRKIFSYIGNYVIKFGFMTLSIHDWTSGYRALKTDLLKKIIGGLQKYNGYVFQIALLDKAMKSQACVTEIPLKFIDRQDGTSKINSPQFILNIFSYMLLHSPFIRFLVVGTIGFGIDFGLSYGFIELAAWPVWLSTLVSTETAVVSNFTLNNFWSFSHKRISHTHSSYVKNFSKFNLISLGSILIQTTLLSLATILFPISLWYIYKAIIIVVFIIPYSYLMYTRVVWRDKKTA